MLLVVGWSSVVFWLNVRPSVQYYNDDDFHRCISSYGFPFAITIEVLTSERPSLRSQAEFIFPLCYDTLAANIAIGLLAVAVLTFASKYLVRATVAGVKSFLSKPPPDKEEGPSESS